MTSTNIAKILNCYPKKGRCWLVRMRIWWSGIRKSKTITAGSQQSAIDYNVFEGHEVKGLALPRHVAGGRGRWRDQDAGWATRRSGDEHVFIRAPDAKNRCSTSGERTAFGDGSDYLSN